MMLHCTACAVPQASALQQSSQQRRSAHVCHASRRTGLKPGSVRGPLHTGNGWLRFEHHPCQRRGDAQLVRGFGDDLLDFINAGPKMRKWYGEGERLPRDGGFDPEEFDAPPAAKVVVPEEATVRDSVLVTDADSATGELVVLRLILAREKVRVLVRDTTAAKLSYGAYVTAIAGDVSDARALETALKGARAVVVSGKLGGLLPAAQRSGLEHLVLLSSAGSEEEGSGFSFGDLLGGEGAALRDPKREEAVIGGSIPYTVVRASLIVDAPGGSSEIQLSPAGPTGAGSISREDLASVLVGALSCVPASGFTVQVNATGQGSPPEDWESVFAPLQQQSSAKV